MTGRTGSRPLHLKLRDTCEVRTPGQRNGIETASYVYSKHAYRNWHLLININVMEKALQIELNFARSKNQTGKHQD